jgi:hypothetical protein
VLETRLIRQVRTRQEADAADELVEIVADRVAEQLPELLLAALARPEVRAALLALVATERRTAPVPPPPPAARRSAARGARRV